MEDNRNEKEMVGVLEKIFSNINSWLTFAEAKNAAIIAFNIAAIAAFFSGADILGKTLVFYLINVTMVVAAGLALIAFIPNMSNNKKTTDVIEEQDNLLLYSHIAKYTKEKYLIALYKKYFNSIKQESDLSKIELDYADEITYNAEITVNKYKWFRRALYVDFFGILEILILIILA